MTFKCNLCQFRSTSVAGYACHFRIHRNIPHFRFPCAFSTCIRTFCTYSAFKSHVFRDHNKATRSATLTIRAHINNLQCNDTLCNKKCSSKEELLSHLCNHIKTGESVRCPYEYCNKFFNVKKTFRSHISRNHRTKPYAFSGACITTHCYGSSQSETSSQSSSFPQGRVVSEQYKCW